MGRRQGNGGSKGCASLSTPMSRGFVVTLLVIALLAVAADAVVWAIRSDRQPAIVQSVSIGSTTINSIEPTAKPATPKGSPLRVADTGTPHSTQVQQWRTPFGVRPRSPELLFVGPEDRARGQEPLTELRHRQPHTSHRLVAQRRRARPRSEREPLLTKGGTRRSLVRLPR
jgi:hypothetical protein